MYGGEQDSKPTVDPYADPPASNGAIDVAMPMNGDTPAPVRRDRSRSRSRSRSPVRNRSPRRSSPPPFRRRSPGVRRPHHAPMAPNPSNVLGVFGLSIRTLERDLEEEFSRHGHVDKVTIVYDQRSGRSRGFGFIQMSTVDEAAACVKELNGIELNGRRIRVDYSVTDRPHQPTPGEYMGHRKTTREDRPRDRYDRDRGYGRDRYDDREHHRDRDRERGGDRDSYGRDWKEKGGRDRDWRDRDRDRRSPRAGRHSPSPPPRKRRSYSKSPPRGSSPIPKRDEGDDRSSRW